VSWLSFFVGRCSFFEKRETKDEKRENGVGVQAVPEPVEGTVNAKKGNATTCTSLFHTSCTDGFSVILLYGSDRRSLMAY